MPESRLEPEQSSGKPGHAGQAGQEEMRKQWGSLIAEPTAFLDLSQDFIDRLRAVAPKRPRPKLRYAAAIAAVVVVVFVAVTAIHKSVVAMHRPAPPPCAPVAETAPPPAARTTATAPADTQAAAAPVSPPAPATSQGSPGEAARQGELAPRAASIKNSRTPRKPHRRAPR